jgi:urea transport system permease protein
MERKNSRWIFEGLVFAAVAVVLIFVMPWLLTDFRLNLLGKFLAFAILALGLDLIWGYTGLLSLGQGVFFGLGGYCMAMYMKLEVGTASSGATTAYGSNAVLPDFMVWNGLTEMPWFWKPFANFGFAMGMVVLIPATLATILGWLTFRNRIRGVYFSIITQALALIFMTLFIGQQAYTGGTNGLTDFKTLLGLPLDSQDTQRLLYIATVLCLGGAYILCRALTQGSLGKVLAAMRDDESRMRFLGYDPAKYKLFVFAVSAALAGLAGALFVPQVGIISPSMMGIVPSIEMVIWVAVGGRGVLFGAVIGAVLVNLAKSLLSESFPDFWLYFQGSLFVLVVLFLPDGLAGLVRQFKKKTAEPAIPEIQVATEP